MVDNVPANYFPLHVFFERLNRAGIVVSIRDYRRISRVLAAEGDWTLQRLERVLGNLLVRDRDERLLFQHEFRGFFAVAEGEPLAVDVQRWRDDMARLLAESPPSVTSPASDSPDSIPEEESLAGQAPTKPVRSKRWWRWLLLVVGVLGAVWYVYFSPPPTVAPPPTPDKPNVTQTDTLSGKPPISDMIKVQVAQQPLEPVSDKRILTDLWLPGAIVAALLAAGLLGVWWTQYRPPNIRQKIPCDPTLPAQYFDDASVGGAMPPWLAEADADHLAYQLSYILTDQYTRELDIPASIRATSEAGSVPVLRFQKRRDLQRILILTDQLVPQQGWHQLPVELVQALQGRGVHLTFGRFNRSPERFMDQHGWAQWLEDWEEYRHHLLLLIFADTHQTEGLQDFPWRDWPDARLLTRQEQRDWDFREQGLQAQGVRLLQADAAGIQQAWGAATWRPAALEATRWEVAGQKPEESDAAFLERVLGAALPWAQALAYYPGAWSLVAAERLREALFADVPRLALQRLLGLPGMWAAADLAAFAPRLRVVLLTGFMRRTRAEQMAVIEVCLRMMKEEIPAPTSLAWAIWLWKCIRLGWVLDPDKAAAELHALVVSVPALCEAIREEMEQMPEDVASAALLVPATRTGRRHLLAVGKACGLKQAVVYAATRWLKTVVYAAARWLKTVVYAAARWLRNVGLVSFAAARWLKTVVYAAARWLRNVGLVSFALAIVLLGVGGWGLGGNTFVREIPFIPPSLVSFFAQDGEQTSNNVINKLSKASQQSQPTTVTPTMVKINGGKFTMGCDSEREDGCLANEKPAHEVNVLTFWMSKTEVTVRQYMVCVNTGACPKPQWQEKNAPSYYKAMGEALIGDNYPIVGVSQPNAIAYVQWLSQQTTKKYRLPTEAEWEYAARAGTNTAYSWGNGIGKNNANCSGDLCGDKFNYTSPVGSFAENPFGLYDMHGNVNEWMEDCWKDNYNDAPVDGNARQGCRMNASGVLRGGAWFYEPQWLRSASRNGYPLDFRINFVGFRIASTN